MSAAIMFKKLKQKIEDGGEGGLDKVSFKPPGSIVRSDTRIEERLHSSSEVLSVPVSPPPVSPPPVSMGLEEREQVNKSSYFG